jgi:hypothetical protein
MKTVIPPTSRLDARLAAYAAVAAAALAAPALPSADATIVWSGNVNINVPTTTSGIYINLVTGVFGTTPASAPGWDLNPWGSTTNAFWANNAASPLSGVVNNFAGGTSATLIDNLTIGTLINGTFTFGRTNGSELTGPTAFTFSSSSNFIGFQFLNEATNQMNFGWAQFQLGATAGAQPRTLLQFAYENTGAAIAVGAVPEPTTYALFGMVAAGAAGLRAWRRRKAA